VILPAILTVAAIFFGSAAPAPAQQVFGGIYGTVTDIAGGPLAGAGVTITEVDKNVTFQLVSNESGNYSKGQLIAGVYSVEVSKIGFKTARSGALTVTVDSNSRLDVTLTIGDVSQSIDVTAAAPLLQTDRADVDTDLSGRQLVDLPNLQRNTVSYLFLSPGVQLIGSANPISETPQGSYRMSVNGQNFGGNRLPVGRDGQQGAAARRRNHQPESGFIERGQVLDRELRCGVRLCRWRNFYHVH